MPVRSTIGIAHFVGPANFLSIHPSALAFSGTFATRRFYLNSIGSLSSEVEEPAVVYDIPL